MKEITVMVFEPGKPGYLKKVPDTLQAIRKLSEGTLKKLGYFQIVYCSVMKKDF